MWETAALLVILGRWLHGSEVKCSNPEGVYPSGKDGGGRRRSLGPSGRIYLCFTFYKTEIL